MPITSSSHPMLRRSEVNTAQNAASAFFNLAGKFFSTLPPDLELAGRYCQEHKSELIAASTNLALSVELSLKALAMATGTKVLRTHQLPELFDALRPEVRTSVELLYNELVKQIPDRAPAALIVYITTRPVPPTEKQQRQSLSKYPKAHDLRSVLKAEQDAFVSWRYFYEAGGGEEVSCYKVEHMRMCAIKNALQAHFSDGKTKRVLPPTPGVTSQPGQAPK
ncbi:MAG: hypothetical protein PSW75_08695 [bacterium]|nr:hypothetical protein [bacterium]